MHNSDPHNFAFLIEYKPKQKSFSIVKVYWIFDLVKTIIPIMNGIHALGYLKHAARYVRKIQSFHRPRSIQAVAYGTLTVSVFESPVTRIMKLNSVCIAFGWDFDWQILTTVWFELLFRWIPMDCCYFERRDCIRWTNFECLCMRRFHHWTRWDSIGIELSFGSKCHFDMK